MPSLTGGSGSAAASAVAPALVGRPPLLDARLRPLERGDRAMLERGEHPDASVVAEQVEPLDDLGVPEDEADAPAGHAVALRHRPQLDPGLLRSRHRQKALGAATVEDEIAVGGVVDDRRAGAVRVGHGRFEDARRGADGARVRGEVEEERGRGRRLGEVGLPARRRIERDGRQLGPGESDPGGVVGVVGVRQQDRVAALGEGERQLDDRRLRAGHDRDLALGVELDAVDGPVAARDRRAERRQPAERRVAVPCLVRRRVLERLDDVGRGSDLGVPTTEVDERRPTVGRRSRHPGKQRREVLLGQPVEALGPAAWTGQVSHGRDRTRPPPFDAVRRTLYPSLEHTFVTHPCRQRRPTRMLTERQQQIWNYLVEYVDRHGYPPTVREIGEEVGLASPSTVHAHLANLERAGLLRRDPTKPRALELLGRDRRAENRRPPRSRRAVRLPLLGEIAAGAPLLAEQNIEEYLTFPGSTRGDFLLRVRGESMIDAGILDGDLVIVQRDARRRATARSSSPSPETTSRPTRRRSRPSTARTDASASSPRTRRSSRSTPTTSRSSDASSGSFGSYDRRARRNVEPFAQTLDQELGALLRGASLECLVCGEFVMHARAGVVFCPECGTQIGASAAARPRRRRARIRRAGRVTAGGG